MKYQKVKLMEPSPEPGFIDSNRLVKISFDVCHTNPTIEGRTSGPFEGKAFYLDSCYDWVLGEDEHSSVVLIPLTK